MKKEQRFGGAALSCFTVSSYNRTLNPTVTGVVVVNWEAVYPGGYIPEVAPPNMYKPFEVLIVRRS